MGTLGKMKTLVISRNRFTKIKIGRIFLHYYMMVSKISKKGQIVIPKEIREKLGFHEGDVVVFKMEGKEVILEKIGESMNEILKNSKPLTENSIKFQRKLRDEWE